MNPARVLSMLAELRILKFFPAEKEMLTALLRLVGNMCRTEDEVRWLVDRMTNGSLYSEWPGPQEMRACFCSRFPPKDNINMDSTIYVDGIPSERDQKQIAAPELPALPPGAMVTADAVLDAAVAQAAQEKQMPQAKPISVRGQRFARFLSETLTAPKDREPVASPTPQIITQADIDNALAAIHQQNTEHIQ